MLLKTGDCRFCHGYIGVWFWDRLPTVHRACRRAYFTGYHRAVQELAGILPTAKQSQNGGA